MSTLQNRQIGLDGIMDTSKPTAKEHLRKSLMNNEHAMQKDNKGFYAAVKAKSEDEPRWDDNWND